MGTIPNLFDLSWSIILKDISRTVQTACKKLFVDATIREEDWQRRAEAVHTLGEVFYEVGLQKVEESQQKKQEITDDMMDKIEIAYVVSMKETQGIKVSQEEKETLLHMVRTERKRRKRKQAKS